MKGNIVDASALLALLKNEPGADKIEALLGSIIMSSVNVSEVAAVLLDSDMTVKECQDIIFPFISMLIPFDEEQAFLTASLRKVSKEYGLSIGDRTCIALGQHLNLPIYTADKIWGQLTLEDVDIRLIR